MIGSTQMTTTEVAVESELLELVDKFLSEISHVTLVEQSRVLDFVLDLRNVISQHETPTPRID